MANLIQVSSAVIFNSESAKNVSLPSVSAGNTILLLTELNSFVSQTAIAVNDGNAYSMVVGRDYAGANSARIQVSALQGVSGGSKTINVAATKVAGGAAQTCTGHVVAIEVANLGTINTGVDAPKVASGSSVNPAVGPTDLLSSPTCFVLALGGGSGSSWTGATNPPATFTDIYSALLDGFSPAAFSYKETTVNTALSVNWGTTVNDVWGAIILPIPIVSGQPTETRLGGIPFTAQHGGLFVPARIW